MACKITKILYSLFSYKCIINTLSNRIEYNNNNIVTIVKYNNILCILNISNCYDSDLKKKKNSIVAALLEPPGHVVSRTETIPNE